MRATEIGTRLRDLRAALGWSQADLAAKVGRQVNAVSEWETGKRTPPRSVLARLAHDLELPVSVFEDGGPMPATLVNRPATARSDAGGLTMGGPAEGAFLRAMQDCWPSAPCSSSCSRRAWRRR